MNKLLLGCAFSVLLASCGRSEFSVDVDAPSVGTRLVTVVYTTDDGDRSVQQVSAVDGKLQFTGISERPSLVELFYADSKQPIVALIAENGEHIKLTLDDKGVVTVEGNDLAKRFVELARSYDATKNYSHEPQVVIDALKSIYASQSATKLPRFEAPELFIKTDSIYKPSAEGIWFFTTNRMERTSAVVDTIKKYHRHGRMVRDIWVDSDTVSWQQIKDADTIRWFTAMLPDALVRYKDMIRSTPALVEVDKSGQVTRVYNFE